MTVDRQYVALIDWFTLKKKLSWRIIVRQSKWEQIWKWMEGVSCCTSKRCSNVRLLLRETHARDRMARERHIRWLKRRKNEASQQIKSNTFKLRRRQERKSSSRFFMLIQLSHGDYLREDHPNDRTSSPSSSSISVHYHNSQIVLDMKSFSFPRQELQRNYIWAREMFAG